MLEEEGLQTTSPSPLGSYNLFWTLKHEAVSHVAFICKECFLNVRHWAEGLAWILPFTFHNNITRLIHCDYHLTDKGREAQNLPNLLSVDEWWAWDSLSALPQSLHSCPWTWGNNAYWSLRKRKVFVGGVLIKSQDLLKAVEGNSPWMRKRIYYRLFFLFLSPRVRQWDTAGDNESPKVMPQVTSQAWPVTHSAEFPAHWIQQSKQPRSARHHLPAVFPSPPLPAVSPAPPHIALLSSLPPAHKLSQEMPGSEHRIGREGLGQLLCLLSVLNKQRALPKLLVNTKA